MFVSLKFLEGLWLSLSLLWLQSLLLIVYKKKKSIVFNCLNFSMCCVLSLVAQLCPTLCDLMDCSLPGSSVQGDSPGKNTRMGCHALLQGTFPIQGLNPVLPTLQTDSVSSESLGKPMNTGVGSLSLLTQESPAL